MKQIILPFHIGQTVYFKTDEEQQKRLVIGIIIRYEGILIETSLNGIVTECYDFELTTNEDVFVKLGIEKSKDVD